MLNIEKEREAFEASRTGEFKNVIFVMNEYYPEGHYVGKSNHNEDTDDAHYLSHSWFSWIDRAKIEAKKLEGCVVVPVEMPDSFNDATTDYFNDISEGENYDAFVKLVDIDNKSIWAMAVEAARGGNE
ncbi:MULTISPECIES: hypothetical protein [unclassified Acinetobacter]|uniref:hypothetical protein n=1 Tax=unclassified Acinetobacter TaxID=196816 RepID=UPI0025C70A77|nr:MULTISPECIES: hypothetical protein [unclassified Acinetobacter]